MLGTQEGHFETVADFAKRVGGKPFLDYVVAPAMSGIYGAPADKLSLEGATELIYNGLQHSNRPFIGIRKALKKRPKRVTSRKGLHGFSGGMQELVDALAYSLRDCIEYNSPYTHSHQEVKGQTIFTVPAHVATQFVDDEVKRILESIHYVELTSTTLFAKRDSIPTFKEGFGCLISPREKLPTLGILFNNSIFEKRVYNTETLSLTCMSRGIQDRSTALLAAQTTINTLYGTQVDILDSITTQWNNAIPLYSPELVEAWSRLHELLQRSDIRLFGNYTGYVSIRQMSDAIVQLAR